MGRSPRGIAWQRRLTRQAAAFPVLLLVLSGEAGARELGAESPRGAGEPARAAAAARAGGRRPSVARPASPAGGDVRREGSIAAAGADGRREPIHAGAAA